MPDLNSLEQFNKILISTGNEPAIAKERNEEIEDLTPPAPDETEETTTSPSEADDFFAGLSEGDLKAEAEDSPTGDDSFFTDLSTDDSPSPTEGESETADSFDEMNIALDDFGLGDLAIPEDGTPPADDAFDLDDLGAPEENLGTPPADDAFDLDDLGAPEENLGTPPADDAFDLDDLSAPEEDSEKAGSISLPGDLSGGFEISDEESMEASDTGFDIPSVGGETPEESSELGDELTSDFDTMDTGDHGFSMEDFDEEFEVSKEFIMDEGEFTEDAVTGKDDDWGGISNEEFATLQKNLNDTPLNVRIEIAKVISSDKYPVNTLKALIAAIIKQQSAYELARLVSRISGKHITVPRSYEKRTGIEFGKEQETFAYRFRETIWPVLRLVLAGTAVLTTLIFLGYRYVYQPLVARNLYVQGLENINLREYEQANRFFDRAYEIWPVNRRFLDYARSFREERQFGLAREKYETLLSSEIDPLNREAILEFSRFSTYDLRDYETALEYLERLILENVWDYDALLSRGDTYLEWAIQFDTPDRRDELLEQARFTYASLIQEYGQEDELLFKMLRYFILTEMVEDVLNLKDLFLTDVNAVLDPYSMTELAGFLLDLNGEGSYAPGGDSNAVDQYISGLKGEDTGFHLLEDAQLVLESTFELDNEIPETHYHLARYSREIDDLQVEMTALRNARELYEELRLQRPLNSSEIAYEIDTYIREGEVFYRLGEVLSAETRYRQAVDLYEQALAARKLNPEPRFGRVYAALGDIYYYLAGDYESARGFYLQAREQKYGSLSEYPERFQERQTLAYKLGFIQFFRANSFNAIDRRDETEQQDLLDEAITEFNQAQGAIPTANLNLLYARANTQYLRQNYYDAAGLYRILLDELTTERASISTFLLEEDDQHKALIDYQIRVNNNLGVTLYRLYQQGGENEFFAQSQLFLSRSTELAENLARDTATAVRADTRSLAYLNLTRILAPQFIGNIQIDPDIRKDLTAATF